MHIKIGAGPNAVRIAVVILAGLCGQSLLAAPGPHVVRVGTCEVATNTILTIQDGVNAAPAGAIVRVCPGTYPEQVEITRSLTLTGVQSDNLDAAIITSPAGGVVQNTVSFLPTINLPTAAQLWVHDVEDVEITNLTVDGSNNNVSSPSCSYLVFGIYFQNASGTVENVATRNQTTGGCQNGVGVWVESGPNRTAKVTIEGSSFQSFDLFGINARGAGTKATIKSNSVAGPGSITFGINGINISRVAAGIVANNSVIDALTAGNVLDDLNNASCGIGITLSQGVKATGNTIGNTQCGIALYGSDNNTILSNNIFGTRVNDGVYVCGNKNLIVNNTILGSDQAGVHLSCAELVSAGPPLSTSTANNNKVLNNTINGACAGILLHSGTTGNVALANKFFNVVNVATTANTCP